MSESIDTKSLLKQSTRELIYNGDPVLRQNLRSGTQILHSEQYPTQVFNLKGTKYIRINSGDLEAFGDDAEALTTDLLKLMLSIDDFSHSEDTDPDEIRELPEIISDGVEEYKTWTGEDLADSELVEMNEFREYVGEKVPIAPKVFSTYSTDPEEKAKEEASEKEELEESEDITEELESLSSAMGMGPEKPATSTSEETKKTIVPQMQEIEQALDNIPQYQNQSRFSSDYSMLSAEDLAELNSMVNSLLKAFRGSRSKDKTVTPKKHINAKGLSMDTDRIYITKKAPKGKHIKFNLVVDMSGSMSGSPMKNAVSLLYLFNKLAQQGFVTGHILYSTTNYHYKITMPVSDAEILSLHTTQSAEGLADTVQHYQDILKNTNLICITDGDITDTPIKKEFWYKNKIMSTGVYINKGLTNVLDYSGKLDKWFTHSLVRQNLKDMVDLLVRIGLKG